MNIFGLLRHFDEELYPSYSDRSDELKIQKLFELFPEELAFLEWRDLNRYIYAMDYFALAKMYYPGIHTELSSLQEELKRYDKRWSVNQNFWTTNAGDYRRMEIRRDELYAIVRAREIVWKISQRGERVHELISMQSAKDVWFGHEEVDFEPENVPLPDYNDVWDEPMSLWDSEASEKSVGLYIPTKKPSSHDELPLFGRHFNRDEEGAPEYIEIPGATFDSGLLSVSIPDIDSKTFLWNFTIAYSRKGDNFRIFLSPKSEERNIRAAETFPPLYLFWPDRRVNEFRMKHLVHFIELDSEIESVYKSRFYSWEEPNTPILTDDYVEVATGLYLHSRIGLYFSMWQQICPKKGKKWVTLFDNSLLKKCLQWAQSNEKIYMNSREYIWDFDERVWSQIQEAAEQRNRRAYWGIF
jgi:hypothetical protein